MAFVTFPGLPRDSPAAIIDESEWGLASIQKLNDLIKGGGFIKPSDADCTIVDLSQALFALLGMRLPDLTPAAARLRDAIGPAQHYVMVLADGFGMNFVNAMSSDAFIPTHTVRRMSTVYPSTTPVVLTSLATARWPSQHGVLGWETYLPEIDDVSTIIKFARTSDDKSLSMLGLAPEQVYPVPSLFTSVEIDSAFFFPDFLLNSMYSIYWSGRRPQFGYKRLAQGIDAIIQRVRSARGPTFSYLYTPHVDSTAHEYGTASVKTMNNVLRVNQELQRLAKGLPASARLMMTADHGLLDAPKEGIHIIMAYDELGELLQGRPSGDSRIRCFRVAPEDRAEFASRFQHRFGDRFVLTTADEAEDSELLGPGKLSDVTRARLGDLIAIALADDVLGYRTGSETENKAPQRSHHSGFSAAEIEIPLVLA